MTLFHHIRNHGIRHPVDVGIFVRIFWRQGVGAQKGGGHIHRFFVAEASRYLEHFQLGVAIQPVPGFDFNAGDAFAEK